MISTNLVGSSRQCERGTARKGDSDKINAIKLSEIEVTLTVSDSFILEVNIQESRVPRD